MSMRVKTVTMIILIIFITTIANFFSGLYFTSSSLEKTIEQDLEFAISIADRLVSTKMSLMKTEAQTVALSLAAADSSEELKELMAEQSNEHSDISALCIFNQDGIIANYSVPEHVHDLNLHADYLGMVYDGETIISSPFDCAVHGGSVMNVYTPMNSDSILAVTMPGETFSDMLSGQRLWQSGYIFMLNEAGMFIGGETDQEMALAINDYISYDGSQGAPNEAIGTLVQKILSSDKGVEQYNFENVESLCAHSRIDGSALGWQVAVTVPLNESPRADAVQGQLYSASFFLAIGVAAAFFLARVTVQPFKKIEDQNIVLEKLYATIQEQAASIQAEHERVRLMLDATPLACCLWNRNFELLEGNDAAVKLFGLKDKQEYLNMYFELSPEYQPDGQKTKDKIAEIVTEAFEKGECTCEWQYRILDSTPLPCEVNMVRVPYGDDYVVASYSRDLRGQRRILAEIEQRDYLRAVVNQTVNILLQTEPESFSETMRRCMGMMAASIHAERMYIHENYIKDGKLYHMQVYEWSESDQLCQNEPADICYDETTPMVKTLLSGGESIHSLVRDLSQADSKWLAGHGIMSVFLIPVFNQKEFWGFVGFDNCRSERLFTNDAESIMRLGSLLVANALLRNKYLLNLRDASARLETALTEAEDANNAKSGFLAHMSHEIRTPLNAVIGLSELTLGEAGLSLTTESNLEKINSAGATILSIVNDILDISKIESGRFELNPITYDIPSLINDTATLNVVRIGEKPITFKIDVDEKLPISLYGDDLRVKQIFSNLLSNAFKYTHVGMVEWRVTFEREGESIWLITSVKDSGIGIKPEDEKKLFSAYDQVDRKTNRKVEGTGLGLTITKRLVEMMGGTISFESNYGKGTVFHVRLRQTLVSDKPISREVAENLMDVRYGIVKREKGAKLLRADLSYARVLVVDDIATNLDVVKGMLKPYKIKVDCVTSGTQAIEMIRAGTPRYNAVFMDHMMPGMDGIEATRIIREEIGTAYARHIPVIALTANAIVGNEEMFLNKGFQAFISKPIDLVKLDFVLRQWVRDKKLEQGRLPAGESEPIPADNGRNEKNGRSVFKGVEMASIDIGQALKRFGGDETTLIDVLRSYAVNTPPLLARLREYLAEKKASDYAIAVHGIKGSSYGIFANTVGDVAQTLEMAAKKGDLDAVETAYPVLEKRALELFKEIQNVLDIYDAGDCKLAAAEPDKALLQALRDACRAFDMDKADEAIERLESFQYERGGTLIAWLREQVNNMTFEVIADGQWPSL